MNAVSLIIPMRNEAQILPDLLAHLRALSTEALEVLFVDGESSDDSRAIVQAQGFTVLKSNPGRARQMNLGARASTGDILLFLHADTRLPAGAIEAVYRAMRRCEWGRFDVRIESRSQMLRVVSALMNRRSRWTGIATGDQALFVKRSVFEAVGGFPDQALMEDIELSRRLRRRSPPACLNPPVTTSGRRWERRGVWRTIGLMWWLRWRYWWGASPEALERAYR